MLRTHILLAFRHLRKEKGYTLVSILGLALAFTACFFTLSFIVHEYSADGHFADKHQLYLVRPNDSIDAPVRFPFIPISNAKFMRDNFPEASLVVPVYEEDTETEITAGGRKFLQKLWLNTEVGVLDLFQPEYFDVRSEFKVGTVLLSQSVARKLFGVEDPIGQLIATEEGNYTVVGTFTDFPTNSHLRAEVFAIPLPNKRLRFAQGLVYVKVPPDTNIAALKRKVDQQSGDMERFFDVIRYTLLDVETIYLNGTENWGLMRMANLEMLAMTGSISAIILFIALFNVLNLTQVKTLFRGREIGIKKVLGVRSGQLVKQFLVESGIVVAISVLVSFSLTQVTSAEVASYLQTGRMSSWEAGLFLLTLALVVVLLLAITQTLLFSKTMPREVMAGKFRVGERKWLLKGLVGLQFLIACALIGGTLLVDKQMDYIMSRPLGFNVNDLWYVSLSSRGEDLGLLKNKVAAIPGVQSATIASGLPFSGYGGMVNQTETGMEFIPYLSIDADFVSTLQLTYIREPDFLPDSGLIVNRRAAVREDLDLKKLAGQAVVGELEDFHFSELKTEIRPLVMNMEYPTLGKLAMRIKQEQLAEAEPKIKAAWEELYPERPFELFAVYDDYLRSHKEATELALVLRTMSLVAIFISCIGLASLTGFFVKRRFKEIAIRKVLGASFRQVMSNVNAGYMIWILSASAMSMILVYYYGTEWLADYAYATSLDIWVVAGPAVFLLLVSGSIMVAQTWKTARENPVEALRTE